MGMLFTQMQTFLLQHKKNFYLLLLGFLKKKTLYNITFHFMRSVLYFYPNLFSIIFCWSFFMSFQFTKNLFNTLLLFIPVCVVLPAGYGAKPLMI
jgi:hypothetical protein